MHNTYVIRASVNDDSIFRTDLNSGLDFTFFRHRFNFLWLNASFLVYFFFTFWYTLTILNSKVIIT